MRSSATVRHSVSSQNASRSASEPPPRATITTSTSSIAASSRRAAAIRAPRGDPRPGRRPTPGGPPSPAAASGEAASPPAPLPGDHANHPAWRVAQLVLGSNRPSASELPAQALERRQEIALARDAQLVHQKLNDGEETSS